SPGLVGLGAAALNAESGVGIRLSDVDFSVIDGISIEMLFQSSWDGAELNYDTFFRKEDGDFRLLLAFQNDPNNPSAIPAVPEGVPVLSFGLNVEGLYHELDMPLDGT